MDRYVWMALTATLGTWFLTALGAALVVFFASPDPKVMNVMLGFAAGVMIAASFWSLLDPAIQRAEALGQPGWLIATAGFLLGAAFLWASDKAVTFARGRQNAVLPFAPGKNRIFMLILSITLHNIPEGLAVGVAFGALRFGTPEALLGAVSVAVGIGLQNFPEGAAIALPLYQEGISRRKAFLIGGASGLVEPVFGLLTVLLAGSIQPLLPWLLSFAAGAMLYVVVEELIPEANLKHNHQTHSGTLGVMAGFLLMMILDVALG